MSIEPSQPPIHVVANIAASQSVKPCSPWKAWLVEILQARAGLYVQQKPDCASVALSPNSLAHTTLAHKKQA